MNRRLIPLLLGLLITSLSWGGEMGQTTVATDLKSEPFIDAQTAGTLPANAQVEILKRQGGWLQVKSASGEGWVKLPSIRLSTATSAKAGDTGVKELINIAQTGRSGSSGTTVATGVRGLSPEDMKNAKPNPDEVKKLDNFAATKSQAESLANKARLTSHKVEYLADTKSGEGK